MFIVDWYTAHECHPVLKRRRCAVQYRCKYHYARSTSRAAGSLSISYSISRRGPLPPLAGFFFGLGGGPAGRFRLRFASFFLSSSVSSSSESSSSSSSSLPLALSLSWSASSGLWPPTQSSKSSISSSDSPSMSLTYSTSAAPFSSSYSFSTSSSSSIPSSRSSSRCACPSFSRPRITRFHTLCSTFSGRSP
ncbi:hypothetical protein K458DRAFT_147472 [Lentithecium fluviatile CBS 122367]|uniref:Uncharacterized protein n=1 Tax=Lentithecium fluviatile CBS 122367 TaxID=1168545 RepID=A0A6G1JDZ9_9PLEO|nr:hypothetical protein K458DRAFT_147472 [Lentithecium fluviatile CBS 122367]